MKQVHILIQKIPTAILVLEKLKQGCEFKENLGHLDKCCLKQREKNQPRACLMPHPPQATAPEEVQRTFFHLWQRMCFLSYTYGEGLVFPADFLRSCLSLLSPSTPAGQRPQGVWRCKLSSDQAVGKFCFLSSPLSRPSCRHVPDTQQFQLPVISLAVFWT